MPVKIVNDKIADFGENDQYADFAIFGNFEGDENTRQLYTTGSKRSRMRWIWIEFPSSVKLQILFKKTITQI